MGDMCDMSACSGKRSKMSGVFWVFELVQCGDDRMAGDADRKYVLEECAVGVVMAGHL
jgi:hypothetical protein